MVDATHRIVLTIGLLVLLAGVFVWVQGPQILGSAAETLGLASHYKTESTVIPVTLVKVAPMNYTSLSANLKGRVQVEGSVEVSDGREVAFYVMNSGNFSLWLLGRPTEVVLFTPVAISSNFTFTPESDGEYFFVFDNHDTSSRVVAFSLAVVGTATELTPIVQYAGYEFLAVGILLSVVGLKTGRERNVKAQAVEIAGWMCKFCREKNTHNQTFCEKCGRSRE